MDGGRGDSRFPDSDADLVEASRDVSRGIDARDKRALMTIHKDAFRTVDNDDDRLGEARLPVNGQGGANNFEGGEV